MKFLLLIIFVAMNLSPHENSSDPIEVELSDYQWENRILLIFSESENDESYQKQFKAISQRYPGIKDRDLIVISVFDGNGSNLDGNEINDSSEDKLKKNYKDQNYPYTFILIGKDGGVKLKSNEFVSMDQLFQRIDRMPMRQREMRNDGS